MDEIDKLLANLSSPPSPPSAHGRDVPAERLYDRGQRLHDRDQRLPSDISIDPDMPNLPPADHSPIDRLFTTLKTEYQERDRQAEQQRQQEIQQQVEQQRQQDLQRQQRIEALRQQRRAEITQTAEAWLRQLKPKSKEGQWFAEFACRYDSPLEAAIDYLEALQEVDRWSTSETL
ncbi:MAG: hypothetical protein VKJ24_17000 [Synechococcales bacterium]|nr:hypothetical protein [Synechococcales bacterium]